MTKAKKGVKRAAKRSVKKKTRKKGGRKSFEPDPLVRIGRPDSEPDFYDHHRGHWMIPDPPMLDMVRTRGPLSGVFAFAMRELERQSRWLRALSQGILIMFRMPGGFAFEDEELPKSLDDRLRTFDRDQLCTVLERCLILLVAESISVHWTHLDERDRRVVREIMSEVGGHQSYRPLLMSIELQRMLERLETNQLLNVVAQCFDVLVLVPLLRKQGAALSPDEMSRGAGK